MRRLTVYAVETLMFLAVALVLSACGQTRSTQPDRTAQDYVIWADDFASRWDDALAVAEVTGRGALAGPVSDLQALRREASAYQSNNVAVMDIHSSLITATDAAVNGFLSFMAEESDQTVNVYMAKYADYLNTWAVGYVLLTQTEE